MIVTFPGTVIDHFAVACLMTWPLNVNETGGNLVLIQTSLLLLCKTSCSDAKQLALNERSREVCVKTRSPPASLTFIGQVTKHTTVKWPIVKSVHPLLLRVKCCRSEIISCILCNHCTHSYGVASSHSSFSSYRHL